MCQNKVTIGLGVITHRRIKGLMRLLQSFAEMKLPPDVGCTVLIAENDDEPSLHAHLDALKAIVPFPVEVAFEPERGIPFARNRVLDMALAGGFDFLTFVDDDQVVHPDWLIMLYATITGRQLDLVGGPRGFMAEQGAPLSREAEIVLRYWQSHGARMQNSRQRKAMTDEEHAVPIYTNNWILRLAKQQVLGTRFDESLRFTGGSDTKFYRDFAGAGAATGWSSDARTTEIWPLERLTLGYLYRRRRDQTTMDLIRTGRIPRKRFAFLKVYRAYFFSFFLVLKAPFKGFQPLANAFSDVGRAMGYAKAAMGRTSSHYQPKNADISAPPANAGEAEVITPSQGLKTRHLP